MSDGTRDQLFFALRLAFIGDYCVQNGNCPVVLDDVLMAFDDARAVAALKALEWLAAQTQVLIFTHHAHHVELAKRALGETGFQLHQLDGALSNGALADHLACSASGNRIAEGLTQ
jgi:uncharacterized protein YhaN